jgi:hypothetical protein
MLSDVIGIFKGFFSRAFWFGNFLPVAVFSFLHLVIAWLVIPGIPLGTWAQAEPKSLTYFSVTFAALVVLAYAITPIIPLVRGLLDGSLLPEWLHDALRREHLVAARAIRRRVSAAYELFSECGLLRETQVRLMWEARKTGNALGAVNNSAAIVQAGEVLAKLQRQFDAGDLLSVEDLGNAAALMVTALKSNATDLPGDPNAKRLDRLQNDLVDLLQDAEVDADNRAQALDTLYSRVAYDNPQATSMADIRFLVEQYSLQAYNAPFDYIWPRLQLVLPTKADQSDENSFAEKLGSARAQIDFAILSLALSVTIPLVWLPYLAWVAIDPVLFVVIGAAAPLLIMFFYHIAVESQIVFGEALNAAIDNYRFILLGGNLRQPLPATLTDERDVWDRLQRIDRQRSVELIYRHPKPQP